MVPLVFRMIGERVADRSRMVAALRAGAAEANATALEKETPSALVRGGISRELFAGEKALRS
jgi:hypothetical protein